MKMLKTRIVSMNYVGQQALDQATRLDRAFEGMILSAVVTKDGNNVPIENMGEFEVRCYEADGLTVERCITENNFDIISVTADDESLST